MVVKEATQNPAHILIFFSAQIVRLYNKQAKTLLSAVIPFFLSRTSQSGQISNFLTCTSERTVST